MKEKELYPFVADWLKSFLRNRYPKASAIWVEDTSRTSISQFLSRHDLLRLFTWGAMLDIPADVTGAALLKTEKQQTVKLAIVEVKIGVINLRDFFQILGYAKVAVPDHAFIISPKGWSPTLQRLVRDFRRLDILEYAPGKFVIVAKWDNSSKSVRPGDVLFSGAL